MITLTTNLPPVPILETERLILRGHRPDDFEAYHAVRADPRTATFVSTEPVGPSESQFKLMCSIGHWASFGWGYWVVELRSVGLIGEVGFGQFRRDLEPSIDAMPEMGWVLASQYHGKGYATEAGRAALDWMDSAMQGKKFSAIIDPNNTGSIRVAQKLGFDFWTTGAFKDEETSIYVR